MVDKFSSTNASKEQIQNKVLSPDPKGSATLIRPWMVKIFIYREDLENRECSGSLLNKKFVITAAHCFCGTVVRCGGRNFKKIITSDEEPLLEQVRVSVRYKGEGEPILHSVRRLIIHPNYYQYSGETVAGNTDVALIMTNNDVFEIDEKDPSKTKDPMIAPICLPPKMGYNPDDDQSDVGIFEAFEDLDCFIIADDKMNVPYPYRREDLTMDKRWLSCHPGRLPPSSVVNKIGKNSFITGFGSTAREDTRENARFQCTTNSYGPSDSILQKCTSSCYKELKTSVDVDYGMNSYNEWGDRNQLPYPLTEGNPSMVLPVCQEFKRSKLAEALALHYSERSADDDSFLGWVKIYDLTPNQEKEIICYPFDLDTQVNSGRNYLAHPYRHGWCTVCDEGTIGQCLPAPQSRWGWCQPQCDEDYFQAPEDTSIREAIVDSFLYENCSSNINIQTEFCTGVPIVGGYGQVWTLKDGEFERQRNELRNFHELTRPDDESFDVSKRRQIIQHTSTIGDVCYGDAGGSVWKYWAFRDGSDESENRVHKLAVLTGVVSRFEEHCGAIDTGGPQHSTHTRVTKILDWINKWIVDGRCYPNNQEPVLPESEMNYEFEPFYFDED